MGLFGARLSPQSAIISVAAFAPWDAPKVVLGVGEVAYVGEYPDVLFSVANCTRFPRRCRGRRRREDKTGVREAPTDLVREVITRQESAGEMLF